MPQPPGGSKSGKSATPDGEPGAKRVKKSTSGPSKASGGVKPGSSGTSSTSTGSSSLNYNSSDPAASGSNPEVEDIPPGWRLTPEGVLKRKVGRPPKDAPKDPQGP